jgi:uncharacterized protein YcaQ
MAVLAVSMAEAVAVVALVVVQMDTVVEMVARALRVAFFSRFGMNSYD